MTSWEELWGKYGDGSNGHHPLACHLIDVLAVAELLWRDILPDEPRTRVANDLAMPPDAAGRWIAALAGLHDLGKASPAFQLRTLPDPDGSHRAALVRAGLAASASGTAIRHDLLTALTVPAHLQELDVGRAIASDFGLLLGGHHGAFPSAADIMSIGPEASGGAGWSAARRDLTRVILQVAGVPTAHTPARPSPRAAMLVTGLVSVADWIGSNTDCFPYAVPPASPAGTRIDLAAYARLARQRAEAALNRLGWRATPAAPAPADFAAMFEFAPRPLQKVAIGLAGELAAPGIVVIEAPTGEGKTEAALYLADRWGATTGARGAYVALPTQATSDQMFGRVRKALSRRYPGQAIVLQLLHGHASLSSEFEELRRAGDRLFAPADVNPDARAPDPSVVAATWFTARKRGLLAPYGVGTIDQSLMAALVVRHVFVRLFGLAGRVVVLDEVHAYDTYMSTLLERLVEWLAALGSSVVLLSATLPVVKRRALLGAYARGAGLAEPALDDAKAYPAVAWTSAAGSGIVPLAVSAAARRTLTLRWLAPTDDGSLTDADLDALIEQLADGGCAAVICNTVERAQATFLRLRARLPGVASDGAPLVDLLHARYPFLQRASREARTQLRFGPGASTTRPFQAILVSTQLIEQSLDLDFDVMVSDFAPVDLLLQRSGRLHRHPSHDPARADRVREPVFHVVRPTRIDDGEPIVDPGSAAVYDDRHLRLRTWLALRDRAQIRVPEEVRDLIESVYADSDPPDALSQEERRAWDRTRVASQLASDADAAQARDRWLRAPLDLGATITELTRSATSDDPQAGDFLALTRLGADAELVVCLRAGIDGPLIDRHPPHVTVQPSVAEARELLSHSLRISRRALLPALRSLPVPAGWRRSPLLREARQLVFDEQGIVVLEGPEGGRPWRLLLDPDLGLVAERATAGGDDD